MPSPLQSCKEKFILNDTKKLLIYEIKAAFLSIDKKTSGSIVFMISYLSRKLLITLWNIYKKKEPTLCKIDPEAEEKVIDL